VSAVCCLLFAALPTAHRPLPIYYSPFTIYHSAAHASRYPERRQEMPPSQLTFITESLPDFTVGVLSSVILEVSGGTPPYKFKITQGNLPQGLVLSKAGKISGKPTKKADTTVFVKVKDNAGGGLTQAFAVRVD
jgi:hypothetical protein